MPLLKKPKFVERLCVRYRPESENCQVLTQATPNSAGYDLYACEAKSILPKDVGTISVDMRWAIPEGFYGKIFSRSGLFLNHMITAEAGVIDSDYRGIIKVLLFNHHHSKPFEIEIGDRIAQVVFMKKYEVQFEKEEYYKLLGETTRGVHGFGSTGKN